MKDYKPTAEQISLHGLGFIQIKLGGDQRMHVWHPDLPRRSCFEFSSVHNHRFSFESRVLAGVQVNRRYTVYEAEDGAYDRISHDGPRSPKGGRLSFVDGRVHALPGEDEYVYPGDSYTMGTLGYHETPNSGIVITIMRKMVEGTIHASSLITHGAEFDQSFDRFQLNENELWDIVVQSFRTVGLGPLGV